MVGEQNRMSELTEHVRANPAFHALRQRRSRFSWMLTGIMLASYYGFIMIVAFKPALLSVPLHANTVVTLAIPVGLGVILLAFVLTGFYILRSNNDFDIATQEIVAAAERSVTNAGHET